MILPLLGAVHCFHRRRCRTQQEQRALPVTPVTGHLPGVIPRVLLRFVGRLLLLVQDNKSKIRQRGKDSRPGPHYHAGLPPARPFPLVTAFPSRQGTVQHRYFPVKMGTKDPHKLGRQGNLRHHDQRCFSPFQQGMDQFQIDLGFPAACNAVQKRDGCIFLG